MTHLICSVLYTSSLKNSRNWLILSFCPSWFQPWRTTFSFGILFNTRPKLTRSLQYGYLEV